MGSAINPSSPMMTSAASKNRARRWGGAFVCLAVLSVAALTGCSSTGAEKSNSGGGDTSVPLVTYTALVTDNTNLNPYKAGALNQQGLAGAVYEPLAITNTANGKLEPWLLEDWTPNADFTEWTLKLRQGITWSDGQPLTSADVVFTIDLLKKTPGTNYGADLSKLTATAKDDRNVVIHLNAPNTRFPSQYLGSLSVASTLYVLPEHVWSKAGDPLTFRNYDAATGAPVGTGPYTFGAITQDTWTLNLRKNWWAADTGFAKMPQPKTLVFKSFANTQAMAAAMTSDQVDNACSIQATSYQTMNQRNPKITSWTSDAPYGYLEAFPRSLEFNTSTGVWADPDLRWAVAHVIDRQKLVDIAYAGASAPNYEPWAALPGLQPTLKAVEDAGLTKDIKIQDLDKAKSILESKGYKANSSGIYEKDGKTLSLSISAFQQPDLLSIADALTQQLQKAGIDAKVNSLPAPQFLANHKAGNFEAEVFFGARGSIDDPWTSMNNFNTSFVTGGPISGNFSNPWRWNTPAAKTYSSIVDQISALPPGDSLITDLVVKAMDSWYKELPSIPLLQSYQICAADSAHWQGWPSAKDPYVQPTFAYDPGTTIKILTALRPAGS